MTHKVVSCSLPLVLYIPKKKVQDLSTISPSLKKKKTTAQSLFLQRTYFPVVWRLNLDWFVSPSSGQSHKRHLMSAERCWRNYFMTNFSFTSIHKIIIWLIHTLWMIPCGTCLPCYRASVLHILLLSWRYELSSAASELYSVLFPNWIAAYLLYFFLHKSSIWRL